MKGLEEITKLYNEFQCSAIEIRYGSNTKADIKPISEKLKEAIDQFTKEIEKEHKEMKEYDNTLI